MGIFERLSNGWHIALSSFRVLKEKKDLIIFPILSGISIILIFASFFFGIVETQGWTISSREPMLNNPVQYLLIFAFYVVNYFVVVFFNMALVHCTHLYFKGEEVTIKDGLRFSVSRIGAIFSWALFAATIGLLLRVIQDNLGTIGKLLTGLIGVVWSIATFFVVPIIAYENVGPVDAVKRSTQLMKEKWGESLGANFSFGLIQFLGIIVVGCLLFVLGNLVDPILGIGLAVVGVMLVFAIISAAQMIFVSAIYHNINGDVVKHFDQQMVDDLFEHKKKGLFNN